MRKSRIAIAYGLTAMAIVAVAASIIACRRPVDTDDKQSTGKLAVFADIPPVAFLVEQIGGRHVDVDTLVSAKADPHIFEPTPRQIVDLSRARIYFSSDMPFDRQIRSKIGTTAGRLTIVDTTAGIAKHSSSCGKDCTHGDHESGHIAGDPHVWLSPSLLKAMARNVASALEKADPANGADYRANLERLSKQIEHTDRIVARRLEPYRGRSFYVFHPAFGYLARAYGLRQRAVQIEGRSPTPKHLAALVEQAKADRITVVFVQGQFDQRAAQTVAQAIGAKLVTIDPLAKDVPANLDELSQKISRAMK